MTKQTPFNTRRHNVPHLQIQSFQQFKQQFLFYKKIVTPVANFHPNDLFLLGKRKMLNQCKKKNHTTFLIIKPQPQILDYNNIFFLLLLVNNKLIYHGDNDIRRTSLQKNVQQCPACNHHPPAPQTSVLF